MSSTPLLAGAIVSIICVLGLSSSIYWATTKETQKTRTETVPVYSNVTYYEDVTVDNRVPVSPVVTTEHVTSWGLVPGLFYSTYQTDLTINNYTQEFLNSHAIKDMLKRVENGEDKAKVVQEHFDNYGGTPYSVAAERQVDTVINYTASNADQIVYQQYNSFQNTIDPNSEVVTLNYEGLNLWWQMDNLPTFLKAWQSFSQIANKMYSQNFQNFMYAHIINTSYGFNVPAQAKAVAFAAFQTTDTNATNYLSAEDQTNIYEDSRFGMSTTRNLTIWIASAFNDPYANSNLTSHMFSGKTQITSAQLNLITGIIPANATAGTPATDTQVLAATKQITNQVVAQGILPTAGDVTNNNLAAIQWSTGSLLNNANLAPTNPTTGNVTYQSVDSMQDIGMNFLTQPEITQSGCDATFTYQQAKKLFNQNLDTTNADFAASILSPSNYFQFQEWYQTQQWSSILGQFGLNQDQATCIYSYAFQQSDYNTYQALGNLHVESIIQSINMLKRSFPNNIASRTLAYRISANIMGDNASCSSYMTNAGVATADVNTICAKYNFANMTDTNLFVNGTWYGDSTENTYLNTIKSETNMTDQQLVAFYNSSSTGSFGAALKASQEFLADKYSCPNNTESWTQYPKNCTADYIAAGQWGYSRVTNQNTPYESQEYFPQYNLTDGTMGCLTVSNWTVPGISDAGSGQAPEYWYYSQFYYKPSSGVQGPPPLTIAEVTALTNSEYSYFGLNNTYNAKMVYYYYSIEDVDNDITPYMTETWRQLGFKDKVALYQYLDVMAFMIQDFTLGGLIAKRSLTELVIGWNSKLINRYGFKPETDYTDYYFKTGDAILYNPHVTPLLDGTQVLRSPQVPNVKINTGSKNADDTGKIIDISGYPYPNRMFKVFTGQTSYEYLPFRCSETNFTAQDVYGWTQGAAAVNKTQYNVLNYMEMQVTNSDFQNDELLCANGTGEACNDAWGQYNNVTQQVYAKTAAFYPNGNCGSRIFSHGTGSQTNSQDFLSGLNSAYGATQNNFLSYDALSTEAPGTNGPQMLHPFVGLKQLYLNLGANQNLPLSKVEQKYNVDPSHFMSVQYPVSTATPTKTAVAKRTKVEQTGTKEQEVKYEGRKVVVWALVLYILAIIGFTVLAVVLLMKVKQQGQTSINASSIAHGDEKQLLADTQM